jgi:hypothetical protein
MKIFCFFIWSIKNISIPLLHSFKNCRPWAIHNKKSFQLLFTPGTPLHFARGFAKDLPQTSRGFAKGLPQASRGFAKDLPQTSRGFAKGTRFVNVQMCNTMNESDGYQGHNNNNENNNENENRKNKKNLFFYSILQILENNKISNNTKLEIIKETKLFDNGIRPIQMNQGNLFTDFLVTPFLI